MKHIVGFSGGIDSQACALWVRQRYPSEDIILTNSNAGAWEDPLTVEFVDFYSRTVFPVTHTNAKVKDLWETPGFAETRGLDGEADLTFEMMCKVKGRPPSRKAQFCTEILKLRPQKRWLLQAFGLGGQFEGQDYCRYVGVRRDESEGRRNYPMEQWDSFFDCQIFAPLVEWSKPDCFRYVRDAGEPINPLYRLGFNRVGCMPCINISKEDIRLIQIRRPEAIEKVRGLERRNGFTFFHPIRRKGVLTPIDQVVAWAQTSRGGSEKQETFPILNERPSCESKYGLCE